MTSLTTEPTVEQEIAKSAPELEDGQLLPAWRLPHGGVGFGDLPRPVRSKAAAKRVAVSQCNRGYRNWRGYVVERKGDKLVVYAVSRYEDGRHVGVDGCFKRGLYFDLDGDLIDVPVNVGAPRLRPSALAEQARTPQFGARLAVVACR